MSVVIHASDRDRACTSSCRAMAAQFPMGVCTAVEVNDGGHAKLEGLVHT